MWKARSIKSLSIYYELAIVADARRPKVPCASILVRSTWGIVKAVSVQLNEASNVGR